MNQLPMRIFIADAGSSEMRLGIAGDIIPQYKKIYDQDKKDSSSIIAEEKEWQSSLGKEKKIISESEKPKGRFMNPEYIKFINKNIKDSVSGIIVIEKNIQ